MYLYNIKYFSSPMWPKLDRPTGTMLYCTVQPSYYIRTPEKWQRQLFNQFITWMRENDENLVIARQSINQRTNHSMDQSVNRSISGSINQPREHTHNQSSSELLNQPTNQSDTQSTKPSSHQLIDEPRMRKGRESSDCASIDQAIDQAMGQPINQGRT